AEAPCWPYAVAVTRNTTGTRPQRLGVPAPAGTPSACGAAHDARSARNRPAPGARLASSGSRLVLYADGLIVGRDRDIGVGLELLREALAQPDRTLICEVSDGSSTAPHLCRAMTTDEGGRGLFLVARYAERRGARYTATGKVIWAERPLRGADVQSFGAAAESVLDQWSDAER
ncbi:ATP-binding protein, partial [Streptomyces nodosus]